MRYISENYYNMINTLITKVRKSIRLAMIGANVRDKIVLCVKCFSIPYNNRLTIKNDAYHVQIRKYGLVAPLYLKGTYEELLLMQEILVEEQYSVYHVDNPRIIVDLGSNIGISVVHFLLRYPQAFVYACEAHPETFLLLQKNTEAFQDRVQVYNVAVTSTTGHMTLYEVSQKNIASSVISREGSVPYGIVPSISMDEFVAKEKITHIDLLKFDIEGAEYEMFIGFSKRNMVQVMIGEIHFDLIDKPPEYFWALLKNFNTNVKPANKKGRFIVTAFHI